MRWSSCNISVHRAISQVIKATCYAGKQPFYCIWSTWDALIQSECNSFCIGLLQAWNWVADTVLPWAFMTRRGSYFCPESHAANVSYPWHFLYGNFKLISPEIKNYSYQFASSFLRLPHFGGLFRKRPSKQLQHNSGTRAKTYRTCLIPSP